MLRMSFLLLCAGKYTVPRFISCCHRSRLCMGLGLGLLGHYSTAGLGLELECTADEVKGSRDESVKRFSGWLKEWFIQCQSGEHTVKHINSILSRGKLDENTENSITNHNLALSEQWVARVLKLGFSVNEFAVGSLVTALSKEGKFDEVAVLIEDCRKRGQIPMSNVYDTWICCLVQVNRVDEALDHFEKRVSGGFVPGSQCCSALLSGLLKNNRQREFCLLLKDMRAKGCVLDRMAMNVAVRFFCKINLVDIAIDLYKERSEIGLIPDNVTYAKLINALCRWGKVGEAHKVLENGMAAGFFPHKRTLIILLNAFCMVGKFDEVYKLLHVGIERQRIPDYSTCNEIIVALSKLGRIDDGYAILCKLREFNIFLKKSTYSALIDGFCVAKIGNMAFQVLLEMISNGHLPGRTTLKNVICILCETGHVDQVLELLGTYIHASSPDTRLYNMFIKITCQFCKPDIAQKILENMKENSCMPDAKTYINLLHGYLKSGYLVTARNLFIELLPKTQFSSKLYNIMVSGLCTIEKQDLAVMYFDEMIRKGMNPSHGCYEKVIHASCKQGNLNKAVKCFEDMKKKGYSCRTFIYNLLLGTCFKLGKVDDAWFVFDDMQNQSCPPNVATFGILIAGLSKAQRLESSMKVMEEMMEQCFTGNIFIYNMLLRGLCKEGKIEVAFDLFSRISKKGCVPNVSTYDSLVQGLCRAGRVDDAQKLIAENKLHPDRYMDHFSSFNHCRGRLSPLEAGA